MPIDPLPVPVPQTTDIANFDTRADQLLAALPVFVDQANTLEENVNALEVSATDAADAAHTASVDSTAAAGAAQAAANFVGEWSTLSGALNKPASVSHNGSYWVLLNNLANVATSQPGVSADWSAALMGNAGGAINLLQGSPVASAASPNIWAASSGNTMVMTGSTNVTGFAAAPRAGAIREIFAAGNFKLVHSANLNLPGQVDYVCAVGDRLYVWASTTTAFFVYISRSDGHPVVADADKVLQVIDVTGLSTADFTAVDSTRYSSYEFRLENVATNNATSVLMRTSTNGGAAYDAGASDYGYSGGGTTNDAASNIALHPGTATTTSSADGGLSGTITLHDPHQTVSRKQITGVLNLGQAAGARIGVTLFAQRQATADIDAVRFLPNAGTFSSGRIVMVGKRKLV